MNEQLPFSIWDAEPTSISEQFHLLCRQWKKTKMLCSNLNQIIFNETYQRIIGLGKPVVPYILCELEKEPDHWGWALRCITGADPVPPEAAGDIEQIAKAWLSWAKENGFIWRTATGNINEAEFPINKIRDIIYQGVEHCHSQYEKVCMHNNGMLYLRSAFIITEEYITRCTKLIYTDLYKISVSEGYADGRVYTRLMSLKDFKELQE